MTRLPRRPLLASLALGAVPWRARAQGATPLRLGALYPLSGPQALLGDESFRGLELATEERNAAGGLLGRPVRLFKGDAVDPTQAALEVRRLLGQERVSAVFGTHATPLAVAASQVTEVQGVPYFEMGAPGDTVTERDFRYLFRSCPRVTRIAATLVEAVTATLAPAFDLPAGVLRIAVLADDSFAGQAISAALEAQLRAQGLPPVVRLSYSARAFELAAMVSRLRAAASDIVLHSGSEGDIVLFYRAMQEAGWRPRMVVGAGGGYSLEATCQGAGPGFENTLNVEFSPSWVNEAFAPGVRIFNETYRGRYGSDPRSAQSLANYAGARIFFDAIHRAGSTDKDRVRAAVLATDIPEGVQPAGWGARFDERGQNVRARPFLMQWQGGRQLAIAPERAALAALRLPLGG